MARNENSKIRSCREKLIWSKNIMEDMRKNTVEGPACFSGFWMGQGERG
jgi:hypothetical protein